MKRTLQLILFFFAVSGLAQNVSLDKKLGAENALMVEQEIGLYHHDSLYKLVNSVGHKLVSRLKNNPFEFRFFLADSEEPNAFALPGGYIYVTRGILPILQTEDELAGIMAHEIIHVMQRHSVKQMKKGSVTSILKIPGNVINAVTRTKIGNILNAPIEFSTKAFISKYERGHESEADKYGIQLAASAGYKTDALADALKRLARHIELLTGEAEKNSYFSDHPYTPSRIKSIHSSSAYYKPVNPSPITSSRETFLKKFEGLCFGPNPTQGVFTDSLFVQPDVKFSWFIPSDWQSINKPTVVAAYAEKGDAMVSLRITDGKKTVHEIGKEASDNASKAEGITILSSGDTTIHANPAYLLRMKSVDKSEVACMELVWLKFGERIFQLAGVSTEAHFQKIHYSLISFRNSTPEELNGVVRYELRVETAAKGETVNQLSTRTANKLNMPLTALINNLAPDAGLSEGELVKIVQATPYQPGK